MEALASIKDANRALRRYLAHADGQLPDDTFGELENLADSPSPVDVIVRSAELLYARREQLDDEGRTVTAQLASFAAVNSWHGMATNNRGGCIAQAMLRDNGEKPEPGQAAFPEADADPAPLDRFAPPPAIPAVAE